MLELLQVTCWPQAGLTLRVGSEYSEMMFTAEAAARHLGRMTKSKGKVFAAVSLLHMVRICRSYTYAMSTAFALRAGVDPVSTCIRLA